MDLEMDGAMFRAIGRILPTLGALESLALGPWPIDPSQLPEDSELVNMPVVSLPSLTNLSIFATGPALDQYLCSCWELPKLTHLTILVCAGWPGDLLVWFGRNLRYLHLYPPGFVFSYPRSYLPTLEACSTLSTVCPLLEHLIVPKLTNTASYPLLLNSPTLAHLDLWTVPDSERAQARQDKFQAAAYRHSAVKLSQSTVPALRTVRFLFTSAKDPWRGPWADCKPHVRNQDWPWICHPQLLSEGSNDVLYYRFPQGWVAQTVAAVIPLDLGERWSKGRDLWEERWPTVYGHLDALWRDMTGKCEADADEVAEEQEQDVQVEATSCGDDPEGGDDGDAHMGEYDAVIGKDAEAREKELQDVQAQEDEEEEDMFEAAPGLASAPEYPVIQLDRAAVLTAFRSSRDRESYHHVDLWDNH